MTNDNGVIDLIQLLNDMLKVRHYAGAVAISEADSTLANAIAKGHDSEIHRLLMEHATDARRQRKEAEAKLSENFVRVGNISVAAVKSQADVAQAVEASARLARAEELDESLKALTKVSGTIVDRAKGLHPLLFEKTTAELIDLLIVQEQREKDMAESEAAQAASSN